MVEPDDLEESSVSNPTRDEAVAYRLRAIGWGEIGPWIMMPDLKNFDLHAAEPEKYEVELIYPVGVIDALRGEVQRLREAMDRYRRAHDAASRNPTMLLSDPAKFSPVCTANMEELEASRVALFANLDPTP